MDGPFMCFDPYSDTPYHVAGNVVHAIHSTNIGTEPIIPPAYKDYLNQGVIRNPKYTNASSFIDASSLFQIDNIQELYRSSSMLKQTLMSNSVFENKNELLINRFGNEESIDKKWNKLGVNFSDESVVESNSRLHDSVLMEAVKIIKEK